MKSDLTLHNISSRYFTPNTYWVRPSDWLTLPAVLENEQKIVMLYAVFDETPTSRIIFSVQGAYTVDWGDGTTPTNYNSGAYAGHTYDYTTISNSTDCSRGYRQVIITITPQSGQNLTNFSIANSDTFYGLDINMAGINFTSFNFDGVDLLERFNFVGVNNITDFSYKLRQCSSLTVIENLYTAKGTNFNNMFYEDRSLQSVPALDMSLAQTANYMFYECNKLLTATINAPICTQFTNLFSGCRNLQSVNITNSSVQTCSGMFQYCVSLKYAPFFDTSNCSVFTNMFTGCFSLSDVPNYNTANGTLFNNMFQMCYNIKNFPIINTSEGTNFNNMYASCFSLTEPPLINTAKGTDFGSMFYMCYALKKIPAYNMALGTSFSSFTLAVETITRIEATGISKTVSFSGLELHKAALVEIFNNLASGVTGQTITISSTPGASQLTQADRDIALNKGWTISG